MSAEMGAFHELDEINRALVDYFESQIRHWMKSPSPKEAMLVLAETLHSMLPHYKKIGHAGPVLLGIQFRISEARLQLD